MKKMTFATDCSLKKDHAQGKFMSEAVTPRQQLLEIFSLASRRSLPAMTEHVTELIALLGDQSVDAEHLAATILKDYALTNKILQLVNSAYFSRGAPIGTISRAVPAVGVDTIRHLAVTMALFEFFSTTGINKDAIAGSFALCLLSATQSKMFCAEKRPGICPEEAYVCSLLHNLGKIVVLVYLPQRHQAIAREIDKGYSEEHACRQFLNGLTYSQVGQEMATFWNFPKRIVACMETAPEKPGKSQDAFLLLQNLVVFSNRLSRAFFHGSDLELAELVLEFGPCLGIGQDETLAFTEKALAACASFSGAMRDMLEKIPANGASALMVHKDSSGRWVRRAG
jgi:eukaryotic-like serine/threonine-protein kinase